MLKDNVVVVIGGLGLIGTSICRAVLENNGVLIIADNRLDKDKISELNAFASVENRVFFKPVDVTSKSSITELIQWCSSSFSKIDAVVNCTFPRTAKYGQNPLDMAYEDFCAEISVHIGSFFLINPQFCIYFAKQGHGNLINFASIYGVIPPKFEIYQGTQMSSYIEYGVSKSAIIHMTKYFAKYFKGKNIRFNTVSPGGVFDDQDGKFVQAYNSKCLNKGMLDSGDVVGAVIYLLSKNSQFINGQNIIVDDGFTLA